MADWTRNSTRQSINVIKQIPKKPIPMFSQIQDSTSHSTQISDNNSEFWPEDVQKKKKKFQCFK